MPEVKELPPSLIGKSEETFVASLGLAYKRVCDWGYGEKAFGEAGCALAIASPNRTRLNQAFADPDVSRQVYHKNLFQPLATLAKVAAYREQLVGIDFQPRDLLEAEKVAELSAKDSSVRNVSRAFNGIWTEVRRTLYTPEDIEDYGSRFLRIGSNKWNPGNVNNAVRSLDGAESAMANPNKARAFGGLMIIGAIADLYEVELVLQFEDLQALNDT